MASCVDLAQRYVEAFCGGDLDAMATLLADDFVITGPLYRFDSASAFLDRLRALNAPRAAYEVQSLHGDDEQASVFFQYRLGSLDLLMAMHFTARAGKLANASLVFDSARLPQR